uniref:50S ribosomal protein L9, chloroplastic n=1 Tax=Inkyuleea mariana TaxID=123988 RepID=A0A4D6X379_9FLOR|nr:ribosomal protein L9 [Inkyuleea mariana]
MKKNINLIIKKTIPKLGKEGNIVKVSSGYAFNYLIPNNFAEIATKGKLQHINMFVNIKNHKIKQAQIEAEQIKNQFNKITKIKINKKIGENQYIFGSVNEKEIITQIFLNIGKKLEKKQIKIPDIKKIGLFSIEIHITDQLVSILKLQIIPENI